MVTIPLKGQAMNTVPFTVEQLGGLVKCEGLLRDEGEHVVLEFQSKDAVAGMLKSGVRELRVPISDLAAVSLHKGWLGMGLTGVTIELQAHRLETLQDVPGMSQGAVRLNVARKDRAAAERFVEELYAEPAPPAPA
jgi:hypothetical protein